MPDSENELRRSPPFTEKFRNLCIGVGALTGLVLGLTANLKGEPIAEKTWTTLRDQVNQHSDILNDLQTKLIVVQAHEEGRAAATLQLKIDSLQKELDTLRQEKLAGSALKGVGGPGGSTVSSLGVVLCGPGRVLDSNGKCVTVPSAVATKVLADSLAAKRSLLEEQKKRKAAEQRKAELQRQVQDIRKIGQTQIQKLPDKLEDTGKLW